MDPKPGFMTGAFRDRRTRVVALVSGIVVMSLADLHLTLVYATSVGLHEHNPVARLLMAYHTPGVLGLWKAASVALGVGILVRVRARRSAEWGAWIGCAILGVLMVQWVRFVDAHERFGVDPVLVEAIGDPTWVRMGSGHAPNPGARVLFGPVAPRPVRAGPAGP